MSARSERLRVLFLITSLEQGGAEQVLFDTVTGLDAARYETRVLAVRRRGPYFEKLAAAGYQVATLDVKRKLAPRAFLSLIRHIRSFRPHIIHAHLFHADLPGRLASCFARCRPRPRFISHQHIPEQRPLPLRRLLERWTAARVDRCICVSQSVAEQVAKGRGDAIPNLVIIPNGRELTPFLAIEAGEPGAREAARRQLGLPLVGPLIGTVGRLDPQKDHALLLEALTLLDQEPPVRLVVAGEGALRGTLEQRTSGLGLSDRVHWLGRRDDVPRLLAALDLFVMSSVYEGLPIAVIEAMAAGLPIVATDVPGLRDVLDNETGRLVPYRDAAALAAAIEELLGDREGASRLGARARERARRRHGREVMIAAHERLYQELWRGHPGPRPGANGLTH